MRVRIGVWAITLVSFLAIGADPAHAGNDYCVSCPNGSREKVFNSIGGELGMTIVGISHSGCLVSYYSPQTCQGATFSLIPDEHSPANSDEASTPPAQPERIGAAVSRERVILNLSPEDFKKLIPAIEAIVK